MGKTKKRNQEKMVKEIKQFKSKEDLIKELERRISVARKNDISCVFIDTVNLKNIDKDSVLLYFREKKEFVDYRRCQRGFFDITINWKDE